MLQSLSEYYDNLHDEHHVVIHNENIYSFIYDIDEKEWDMEIAVLEVNSKDPFITLQD